MKQPACELPRPELTFRLHSWHQCHCRSCRQLDPRSQRCTAEESGTHDGNPPTGSLFDGSGTRTDAHRNAQGRWRRAICVRTMCRRRLLRQRARLGSAVSQISVVDNSLCNADRFRLRAHCFSRSFSAYGGFGSFRHAPIQTMPCGVLTHRC
jgi:hypothetical protein